MAHEEAKLRQATTQLAERKQSLALATAELTALRGAAARAVASLEAAQVTLHIHKVRHGVYTLSTRLSLATVLSRLSPLLHIAHRGAPSSQRPAAA